MIKYTKNSLNHHLDANDNRSEFLLAEVREQAFVTLHSSSGKTYQT